MPAVYDELPEGFTLDKPETNLMGEAGGVLARAGRATVGGLAGAAGMVADPIQQFITRPIQEAVTGEKPAYVPFRTAALKGYDVITGDAGLPRNQLERVVQGGGEALAGSAAFVGIPKMAVQSVTDIISQVGAGGAAQWAAENSDNPLAPVVASLVGAIAPQAAQSAIKGTVPTIAKSFGINPEKVAQVERTGMPLNVPAVSDSPMIKRAANQMAELPGGKALKKSMDDAFGAAEKAIKSQGFTGKVTPTTAGETVSKAFTRWKADSLAKFKAVDDALQAAVPDDAPVSVYRDVDIPLDTPSRLSRAKEMGFNVDNPVYHGTTANIDNGFIPSEFGKMGKGVYFSTSPKRASVYAEGEAGKNIKSFIRGKVASIKDSSEASEIARLELKNTGIFEKYPPREANSIWKEKTNQILKDKGFSARNIDDEILVFDPKDIRSANSPFNLDDVNSSDLIGNYKTKQNTLSNAITSIVTEKGLTPRQIAERANHPAIREMQSLVDDAARNGGQLTLGALKEARTKIGNLPAPNPLMPSKKDALTDRAYGQLTKLMEDAYEQVGGKEAKAAFAKRNILYKNYADEQTAYLGKLQKKLGDSPEAIFNTLTTGERIGATRAGKILAKLNPDELETVRDAMIFQKGGKDNFNIGTWANSYGKMSQEAKAALFGGDNAALKAHDDLIQAVNNYKDVGKFANFSGTTASAINPIVRYTAGGSAGGAVLGILTGAISIPTLISSAAISAGSAFAINKALSGMMASPKYTKMLSNALTNASSNPQKYEKALIRAFADYGVSKDDLQAIQEVSQDDGFDELPEGFTIDTPEVQLPATIPDQSSFTQQNEGLRLSTYTDTEGNPTVGYGFNFNSGIAKDVWKEAGISAKFDDVLKGRQTVSESEAKRLGIVSQQIAMRDAYDLYPRIAKLSQNQQLALKDLSYNMGKPRLMGFREMNKAINEGNMRKAVIELMRSEYAKQVPNRARKVAKLLLT